MNARQTPEGFEAPVHRSLVERMLIAGLPREFALIFWTTAGALVFGMRVSWMLPIAIVLHLLCVGLAKRDPFFFEIFIRAVSQTHRLEP